MKKKFLVLIISISLVFFSLNFFFKPDKLANINSSTITGLATMRAMASRTISYDDAIANSKPTFIEFYADWCTTCQSMSPIVKEIKNKYDQKINFVMINIDNSENNQLIKQYQVTGVPQWNFLDSNGKNIDNLIGKVPKKILESMFLKTNV